MTFFSIQTLPNEKRKWTNSVGRLQIDDLDEDITLQTELLSFRGYENHWRKEIKSIVSETKIKTFLFNEIILYEGDELI